MNAIITSNGLVPDDFRAKLKNLIGKDTSELKLLYDMTAVDGEPADSDKSWADIEYENILKQGFKPENITKHKIDKLDEDLSGYDVIYVLGGNSFYLMAKIREFNFEQSLRKAMAKGLVYIGSSAGSVVAGAAVDSAFSCGDPNEVGLEDFAGMNLVDGAVFPHYDKHRARIDADKSKFNKSYLLNNGDVLFLTA